MHVAAVRTVVRCVSEAGPGSLLGTLGSPGFGSRAHSVLRASKFALWGSLGPAHLFLRVGGPSGLTLSSPSRAEFASLAFNEG